jgi:AcrR family transcriptional regulator
MTQPGVVKRPLRADAVRNRARIMAAAAEIFAERGLDVTLDDIAARAGLGVGTVYRRFVDREALIEALFDERMRASTVRMRRALDSPDAWQGLIDCILSTCEELARDRGMRQIMLSGVHGQAEAARCRGELHDIGVQLVDRAKAEGSLRQDFQPTDVPMLFLMVGSVADFAGASDPDVWRRYLNVLIAGMRAPGSDRSDGMDSSATPALGHDAMLAAINAWRPPTLR